MSRTTIRTEDITASEVTTAKMATDPTNASNLASGTVPTARLGSGTANSTTFLRGDQTYAEAGGGVILQLLYSEKSDIQTLTGTTVTDISDLSLAITPASASNKIYVTGVVKGAGDTGAGGMSLHAFRDSTEIGLGDAATGRVRGWGPCTPTQQEQL